LSASDWRGEHGESESRGRSTSSKAVIVGAATAAIVSTVLAIVITSGIVGMRGGQSGEGGSASLLPSFSDGAKRMFGLSETNPTPAELMIKEAVNLINGGNLVAARILLERATGLGSGVAALALGETYDPTRAARLRTGREEVDPAKAREWYQRALALGSGDALSRLAALDGKQ
jgi:TPR repeat protein